MGFSLPFFKKNTSSNLYFGLYLTDASAFGFVFDTSSGQSQILAQNAVSLTAGFDKILEDTDNLISQLELQTNRHLDKTIFFLHSWMIDDQTFEIKEPYKTIIKKLSKDLELEPMGYIDVQDALHEHLKKTSVLNTIAIEVNKTKLGIFIFKGGKKVFSQYTARTDVIGEDIQSVFASTPGHLVLPSKIIVFGDMDTPEVSSELATYGWDSATFSQHPTIEVIKQNEINQSLVETFTEEVVSQSKIPSPSENEQNQIVQTTDDLREESAQDFGFMVGKDVRKEQPAVETAVSIPTVPEVTDNADVVSSPAARSEGMFNKLKSVFSSFSIQTSGANKKPIVYGVVFALVVFLLLFVYEYFFHKMEITVYPKTRDLDETFSIDVPISDTETDELAVLKKTTVQEFEDEKKASGKRDVGEKATGEVIIHNYDKEPRTFPRGTELRKGDLVFVIDSEVKVASASGGTADGVKESGKAKVKATAEEIGPEYNISKGTQLSVASLSDSLFTSFVETAFTGGSKKEVTTISKADLDALKQNVEKKAEAGSREVLGAQISEDDIIIPDLTTISMADTTYSGEVGEEAASLKITAESEIEFYTVKKKAIEEKLKELLGEEISSDYSIDGQNLVFDITDIDADEDAVTMDVETAGKAYKKIDMDVIKKSSAFKTPSTLVSFLKNTYDVEDVGINKSFGLSFWTPLFQKNITVVTETE